MNWYFHNLKCGLKTACFLRCEERMHVSWHALILIAVSVFLGQLLLEFIIEGQGGEFIYGWYNYHSILFVLIIGVCYLAGIYNAEGEPAERILGAATAFYYSFFFIFMAYAFTQIFDPSWYDYELNKLFRVFIVVWAFLIMFRIASEYIQTEVFHFIYAGALMAAAIYIMLFEVYFSRIYAVNFYGEDDEPSILETLTSEELFNKQDELRQQALDLLQVSKPGVTDIYGITFGSYAYQNIFMREVAYVNSQLSTVLGVKNVVSMVNNEKTVEILPIANSTNMRKVLKAYGETYMQPEEDILFIYLTSHGSAENGLSVELNYYHTQMDLSQERFAQMLEESGIKNRVIIISACYSGTFIDSLKNENTMVITAAASDKTSFGCSDRYEMTYFAQAFFKHALNETTDLELAFYRARDLIEEWERSEGITPSSDPQIFIGDNIQSVMNKYKGADLVIKP